MPSRAPLGAPLGPPLQRSACQRASHASGGGAPEYAARTLSDGVAFLSRSAEQSGVPGTGLCKGAFLPPTLQCPTMALVALPELPGTGQARGEDATALQDALHRERVECPVKLLDGRLFLRVSVWIYNEHTDFVALDRALHAIWPPQRGAPP